MHFLSSAYRTVQRRVIAQEVFGLYEKHKNSDLLVTQKVSKVFRFVNFYSIELESTSLHTSEKLKIQAKLLAPKLQNLPEFQDPKWEAKNLSVTNCLLFDAGILVDFIHESGKRCSIGTARTSSQIRRETCEGVKWEHYPDKPEAWMSV